MSSNYRLRRESTGQPKMPEGRISPKRVLRSEALRSCRASMSQGQCLNNLSSPTWSNCVRNCGKIFLTRQSNAINSLPPSMKLKLLLMRPRDKFHNYSKIKHPCSQKVHRKSPISQTQTLSWRLKSES